MLTSRFLRPFGLFVNTEIARVNNTFVEFLDMKLRNNILLKEMVMTFGT